MEDLVQNAIKQAYDLSAMLRLVMANGMIPAERSNSLKEALDTAKIILDQVPESVAI